MKTEEQKERIENFILGKLDDKEMMQVNKELLENPELQTMFKEKEILIHGIRKGFDMDMKQLLKSEESLIRRKKRTRKINYSYIAGIAASILLIVASFIFFSNRQPDLQKLYADFYAPYPNVVSPISRDNGITYTAYNYYENGNYTQALEGFMEMQDTDPENTAVIFYTGLTQLALMDNREAIKSFGIVSKMKDERFERPALWYTALAWISLENTAKAREVLIGLKSGDDKYAKDAKALLKKIR